MGCGIGYRVITLLQIFCMWIAACILGLKYKMTALKISNAINYGDTVKRDSYKKSLVTFRRICYLSIVYFSFVLVVLPGVMVADWP